MTSMTREEADVLAERARLGDQGAFEQLVAAYWKLWCNAVYQMGHKRDVEDIVQEATIKMWRKIGHIEPGTKWFQWSYTVVRHTAIDLHRHLSHPAAGSYPLYAVPMSRVQSSDDELEFDPPAIADGPEELAIAADTWERITASATTHLTSNQQAVLHALVAIGGADYGGDGSDSGGRSSVHRAIGAHLGLTQSAVKTIVFRLRRNLLADPSWQEQED